MVRFIIENNVTSLSVEGRDQTNTDIINTIREKIYHCYKMQLKPFTLKEYMNCSTFRISEINPLFVDKYLKDRENVVNFSSHYNSMICMLPVSFENRETLDQIKEILAGENV